MSGKITKRNLDSYRVSVRQLSKDEGGGFLAEYPDIPGCMSDGETIEEAIANGREALRDCIEVFKERRRSPETVCCRACAVATAPAANTLHETHGTGRKRRSEHQQSRNGDHRGGRRPQAGSGEDCACLDRKHAPRAYNCLPEDFGSNFNTDSSVVLRIAADRKAKHPAVRSQNREHHQMCYQGNQRGAGFQIAEEHKRGKNKPCQGPTA